MTKPEGYEKQRNKFSGLAKILYRKYPKIAENLVISLLLISFWLCHNDNVLFITILLGFQNWYRVYNFRPG
jgi:hypothetical protein